MFGVCRLELAGIDLSVRLGVGLGLGLDLLKPNIANILKQNMHDDISYRRTSRAPAADFQLRCEIVAIENRHHPFRGSEARAFVCLKD